MTFESNALGNRFHFDLSANFNRTVEREYSSNFQRDAAERSGFGNYSKAGFYRAANSINVLERALSDGLGKNIDFNNDRRDTSPARIIARNVLGFVRQELREARENGASEEGLQRIVDQARKGIEQGFNSAREALQGRLKSESRLDRQIERAYNKIQRGLERLDNRFAPNVETTPTEETPKQPPIVAEGEKTSLSPVATTPVTTTRIEYTKTIEVLRSRSFDLSIETQEGDTVTFSIEQFYSKQTSKEFVKEESGFSVNVDRQTVRGEDISYNVNGDINKQEQAAIDALIKKVDRLADKFYSGNIAGAFRKATRVGIDAEQLASFSLNLQSSKSVEINKTYRETQGVPVEQQLPSPVEKVGEFVSEVGNAVKAEPVSSAIADPVPVATELFKQIVIRDERYAQLLLEQNVKVINDIADTVEEQLANVT